LHAWIDRYRYRLQNSVGIKGARSQQTNPARCICQYATVRRTASGGPMRVCKVLRAGPALRNSKVRPYFLWWSGTHWVLAIHACCPPQTLDECALSLHVIDRLCDTDGALRRAAATDTHQLQHQMPLQEGLDGAVSICCSCSLRCPRWVVSSGAHVVWTADDRWAGCGWCATTAGTHGRGVTQNEAGDLVQQAQPFQAVALQHGAAGRSNCTAIRVTTHAYTLLA
jgi:hypothetical protein